MLRPRSPIQVVELTLGHASDINASPTEAVTSLREADLGAVRSRAASGTETTRPSANNKEVVLADRLGLLNGDGGHIGGWGGSK